MKDIPHFCVIIGANGTGKTTLFNAFGFLKDAFTTNVTTALIKQGGSRGFDEVRSRQSKGDITFEIKFRIKPKEPLVTYFLAIGLSKDNKPMVQKEYLEYRRGRRGKPWRFLEFSNGEGKAVVNETALSPESNIHDLKREDQTLKSADILAIKGLGQFERFPAVVALSNLIENWHISDFHISKARPEQDAGSVEHLSREGENLSLYIQYLHDSHKSVFDTIITEMKRCVPGIVNIETKTTEEGRMLLKFQDGSFAEPFLARYVSDGTIKMLAYLALLHDPRPHSLLCIEEPENQLYPKLLNELAEAFRDYARRGGQVFVSTHSPDFLDATQLEEVFWLIKENGYTQTRHAKDTEQVAEYMQDGDKMGRLWMEGIFPDKIDPK